MKPEAVYATELLIKDVTTKTFERKKEESFSGKFMDKNIDKSTDFIRVKILQIP